MAMVHRNPLFSQLPKADAHLQRERGTCPAEDKAFGAMKPSRKGTARQRENEQGAMKAVRKGESVCMYAGGGSSLGGKGAEVRVKLGD